MYEMRFKTQPNQFWFSLQIVLNTLRSPFEFRCEIITFTVDFFICIKGIQDKNGVA